MFRVASAALSFCLLSRSAARHACPQATARSLARAPTIDGRTTRRAVRRRGWLDHCTTGECGAHAHCLGGLLSSRPLSPLPCNAAAPKGPTFCFFNYPMRPSLKVRPLVEPIPPFSKCAILLVFVAQSTSHRCKSHVGFLFSVSMGLYTPQNTKMTSFFFKCTF